MHNKDLKISELIVNTENPRFDSVKNQTEALDMMLEKHGEEIKKLALDIATHGLNPSKKLIVIKHKGKYIPQEGNRRTIALLLLNNPNKTENKEYQDYFKKIKLEFGDKIPQKISVVVFDNKESASKWVNLEHTGKNNGVGVLPWNSEQKSRFIAMYNGNKSKSLQIFDFTDSNLLKRENVDPTTLDRIMSSPSIRKLIGIDFKDGNLEIKKDKKETISNLNKVFSGMSHKNFKVGDVYTVTQRESWVKNILGITDKNNKNGEINQDKKEIQERSDQTPKGLFWSSNVPYKLKNSTLKILYDELKNIDVKKFSNATHDLLRSFLECSLAEYLTQIDEYKKVQKSNEHNPKLGEMLTHVINEKILDDNDIIDILKDVKTDWDKPYSIERMNKVNHNKNYASSESDVRITWGKLEPFFKIILNPKKNK